MRLTASWGHSFKIYIKLTVPEIKFLIKQILMKQHLNRLVRTCAHADTQIILTTL